MTNSDAVLCWVDKDGTVYCNDMIIGLPCQGDTEGTALLLYSTRQVLVLILQSLLEWTMCII